jgi:hypothetical protein
MHELGIIHYKKDEYEHAVEWFTKGVETGVPKAMFMLGRLLDEGKGVAAPDSAAAANWFRRAADAGVGVAAVNLATMYAVGRGRPGR